MVNVLRYTVLVILTVIAAEKFLHSQAVTINGVPSQTMLLTVTKITPVAIGSLSTCNAGAEGTISAVNDALTPVALAAVVAGGAVKIPVYCNGTTWIVM